MGEEFFDTVFNLTKGTISSVIKSNVGYHIVRVVDVDEPRLLALGEKVSDEQNITVNITGIFHYVIHVIPVISVNFDEWIRSCPDTVDIRVIEVIEN